jgi:outer membrane protein assembly factor BamB
MKLIRPIAMIVAAAALSACGTVSKAADAAWPFNDGKPKKAAEAANKDGRISILAFEEKLEPAADLTARTPAVPAAVAVTEWRAPGGPANNAPPPATLSDNARVAERKGVGDGSGKHVRISAPPVVADGKLYVLDADQNIHAYSADGLNRLWSKHITVPKKRDKSALGGGIAIDNGKIFVSSGYGFVAALDASSGAEIWRTEQGAPFHAAPTASGGRVFVVSSDSELYAIDENTGAVQWTHQAIAEPARILSASSPGVTGDIVVAPFASGEVVALLAANGRRLWVDALTRSGRNTSLAAINDIAGRPVILDGVVYAASHSGILAAIDQRSGQRIWARAIASTQTPFVAGDALFVVTVDGELAAFERLTGKAYWVTQLERFEKEKKKKGRISWTGPLLAGNKLVLASSTGDVVMVDPTTGAIDKKFDVGGPVFIPPIAANGSVYLLTDEGKLVVLR